MTAKKCYDDKRVVNLKNGSHEHGNHRNASISTVIRQRFGSADIGQLSVCEVQRNTIGALKMRKINENDYKEYSSWARENTANRVYPCSITEGFQSGDVYVNDGADVESVFFWHYCGFGYISGHASDDFLQDIYSEMISGRNGRRQNQHYDSGMDRHGMYKAADGLCVYPA